MCLIKSRGTDISMKFNTLFPQNPLSDIILGSNVFYQFFLCKQIRLVLICERARLYHPSRPLQSFAVRAIPGPETLRFR